MATEFEKKRELKAAREKLEELWVASFLDKFHRPAAQTLVKVKNTIQYLIYVVFYHNSYHF